MHFLRKMTFRSFTAYAGQLESESLAQLAPDYAVQLKLYGRELFFTKK